MKSSSCLRLFTRIQFILFLGETSNICRSFIDDEYLEILFKIHLLSHTSQVVGCLYKCISWIIYVHLAYRPWMATINYRKLSIAKAMWFFLDEKSQDLKKETTRNMWKTGKSETTNWFSRFEVCVSVCVCNFHCDGRETDYTHRNYSSRIYTHTVHTCQLHGIQL